VEASGDLWKGFKFCGEIVLTYSSASQDTKAQAASLISPWRALSEDFQKVERASLTWINQEGQDFNNKGCPSDFDPRTPNWLLEKPPSFTLTLRAPRKFLQERALKKILRHAPPEHEALLARKERYLDTLRTYLGGPQEQALVDMLIALALQDNASKNMSYLVVEICKVSKLPEARNFCELQLMLNFALPSFKKCAESRSLRHAADEIHRKGLFRLCERVLKNFSPYVQRRLLEDKELFQMAQCARGIDDYFEVIFGPLVEGVGKEI
jgi:hypothetical protein